MNIIIDRDILGQLALMKLYDIFRYSYPIIERNML